jgi:hypothetical protein
MAVKERKKDGKLINSHLKFVFSYFCKTFVISYKSFKRTVKNEQGMKMSKVKKYNNIKITQNNGFITCLAQ